MIAAPITSGDTALRSARLIAADFMGMEQKTIVRRLMISVPIFLPLFRDNAHALRRTLALLRMVQSGAVGFHALDSDRMAGPQPQAVHDHIAACNVHDMRHRDIHILRSRGIPAR